jgi:uncharacterized protein YndB with AHSA1/START domain
MPTNMSTPARAANTLEVTTPSPREIAMTRVFDAPRALVWDAHTKPELVRRWLGFRNGWTMTVCEMDVRVGGSYRWVWRKEDDGFEMGMGGVYREVAAPERLVNTESFDQKWYEGDGEGTMVLTEKGGKTTLTTTVKYASQEVRDSVLRSPMEKGVAESYDNLEALLASLPAGRAGR